MIMLDSSGDVLVSLGKAVVTTGSVALTAAQVARCRTRLLGPQPAPCFLYGHVQHDRNRSCQHGSSVEGPGSPAAAIGASPEQYEGSSAFSWGTNATVPTASQNQNICAGA